MRQIFISLAACAALVAACGGGSAATPAAQRTAAPGQPTAAPGQPTAAPGQPTTAPATQQPATAGPNPGGATATVVLTGGSDAGTYSANGNPNCSHGFVGTGVWAAQFTTDGGAGELTSVQLVLPDAGVEDAHISVAVTIGPVMSGNTYSLLDQGSGTATDNGATATLHVAGTSDAGVQIDITVNCPAVTRA